MEGEFPGGWELFDALPRLPKDGFMEPFNLNKNLLRFFIQRCSPLRELAIKTPQSDCSSVVDKYGVEGNLTTTPGAKRGKTGTSGASFM